jgi:hypothetical protein
MLLARYTGLFTQYPSYPEHYYELRELALSPGNTKNQNHYSEDKA